MTRTKILFLNKFTEQIVVLHTLIKPRAKNIKGYELTLSALINVLVNIKIQDYLRKRTTEFLNKMKSFIYAKKSTG